MKPVLRGLGWLFAALLLLLLIGIGYVAGTGSGLRWALGQAENRTGDTLQIGQIDGSLLRGVHLQNLRFHSATLTLQIDQFQARWQASSMLRGLLKVQSLHAQGVRVHTEPGDQQQAGEFPPQFSTPMGISLAQAVVEDLSISQADQDPLKIERIELGATLQGNRLHLDHLAVTGPSMQLSGMGTAQLGDDYSTDLTVKWALQTDGEHWRGAGTIKGDRTDLRIHHQLDAPLQAQLQAQLEDVFDKTRWQAKLDVRPFDADALLRQLQAPAGNQAPPSEPVGLGQVEVHANLHGDRTKAVLDPVLVHLPDGDRDARLEGSVNDWLDDSRTADLTLQWRNLQWPLRQSPQVASATGSARLRGGMDDFLLRLDAALSLPGVANAPAQLQVNGALRNGGQDLRLEQIVARETGGSARIQMHGQIGQWHSTSPQLDIDGSWQQFQWPLQGTPQASSNQGNFSVQGGLDDYRFQTKLELAAPQLPSSQWQIKGDGNLGRVQFQSIDAQLLDGSMTGSGSVAWKESLRWQFALQLQNLNPGTIDSAWPGKLDGRVQVSGAAPQDGPSLQLTLQQVRGTLRQRRFEAEAKVALAEQRWRVEQLQIRSGDAKLDVHGDYGERLDLAWKLDASQLADLLPHASGSLHASGAVQGTSQAPRMQAKLDGQQLRYQDYSTASLKGSVAAGIGPQQPLKIDLQATQLSAAGNDAERLTLTGSGTTAQHQMELQIKQADAAVKLVLAGGVQSQSVWHGELRTLRLSTDRLGTWQLQQPAALTLAADHAALDRVCLQRQQGGVCMAGQWRSAGPWSGKLELNELPLAALAQLMPEDIHITGTVDGNVAVASANGSLSKVDGQLRLSSGAVRYKADAEHVVDESFGGGVLKIGQKGQQLVGELQIDLAGKDRVAGEVRVAMPSGGTWTASRVDGHLNLQMARWDIVEVFVPQVSGVDGNLQGSLTLAGTVGEPQISGEARLRASQVELPQAGTVLKDVDLRIADAGRGTLQLQGSAHSGGGVVRIQGDFKMPSADPWRTQLHISGDRFLVVNTTEAKAYISPNLDIRAQPKRIDVSGELTVPEAELTPSDGRSAVKPSSDVEVIRNDEEQVKQQSGWVVYAKIRLKLGDKVHFTGYGFDGRISGTLALDDVPNKITTATGTLDIHDASYTAYGKTLTVDSGSLSYSGNPVTNPGLSFTATRTIQEIKVGVQVSGTASNPRLELFSDPTMSDGDILSYLITGKPLSGAGQGDSKALMAAATSAGLAKGAALAEKIGHQLGFQDVSVGQEGDSDKPWLTVGRYLSPKLYVSYGVGLFEPGNVVRLRYELTKHWKVQGETGSTSGADLLYTIER